MPYIWKAPDLAIESLNLGWRKIYHTYKDNWRNTYWFCLEEAESDEGGRHFDIRNQKIYRDLEKKFQKTLTETELTGMSLAYLARNTDKIIW